MNLYVFVIFRACLESRLESTEKTDKFSNLSTFVIERDLTDIKCSVYIQYIR